MQQFLASLRRFRALFAVFLVLLLVVFTLSMLKLRMHSSASLALAHHGVESNAEWEPVIARFGWQSMALVPAGCFFMGSTDAQLAEAYESCGSYFGAFGCQEDFSNEQPAREVCFSEPYWIGLTEVTNWQYALKQGLSALSYRYSNLSWPRSSIDWMEAQAFCESIGGRLPTEAEWEFAARGPDSLIYPYGDVYEIQKATLRKIGPMQVGLKPEGASWVGALDMSGGMSEWVADEYSRYDSVNLVEGQEQYDLRVAKGGDWFAHASYQLRAAVRFPHSADTANSTIGFRCARRVR